MRDIVKSHKVKNIDELPIPRPTSPPVPYLKRCTGYRCMDCPKLFTSKDSFGRKKDHASDSCSTASGSRIQVPVVQRWHYRGTVFEVASSAVEMDQNSEQDNETTEPLAFARQTTSVASEGLLKKPKSKGNLHGIKTEWYKAHRWDQTFSDVKMSTLLQAIETAKPGDNIMDLMRSMCYRVFLKYHARIKQKGDTLRWALNHDRSDLDAANRRPFGVDLDSTVKTYAGSLALHFFVLHRISGISSSSEDAANLGVVYTKCSSYSAQVRKLFASGNDNDVETQMLCIARRLIEEEDGGPLTPSTLRVLIACSGMDTSGAKEWLEARKTSKILSGIVYCYRALAYGAHELIGDHTDAKFLSPTPNAMPNFVHRLPSNPPHSIHIRSKYKPCSRHYAPR
ncbi:hypothetical protein CF319_g7344 [Tilletia indica]|nr:hypothetical protein CF319_g7344 [Tilletia indica]